MDNNVHLVFGEKNIRLIGTAHVSKDSINEVTETIRSEMPAVVCVELDQGRYASITRQDNWEKLNISKVLKEGKGFLLLANLALASFQRRLGNELGVKPGDEMIAAVNTALELGIEFSLCDREVQTTLRRAWANCGFWSKCKLLAALLSSAFVTEKLSAEEIESLKNSNELDGMMAELSGYLPAVKETLIDERDRYLAAKIWESSGKAAGINAAGNPAAGNPAVGTLAVVGAGHLKGIQAWLEKFAKEENEGAAADTGSIEELNSIPKKSGISKLSKWIIPAILVALITTGLIRADFNQSVEILLKYILWNGCLAALGCIIALGHPLSVLVSFICAPFTTMIPFIGVGMVSGLVQAAIKKPSVQDAENISADSASLKGMYRNRITRVLMVFFFSSLGSSTATFVLMYILGKDIYRLIRGY